MQNRKALMSEMPGGTGTLDELFEMLTRARLEFHDKLIGLPDTAGCYDGLLAFGGRTVQDGFVQAAHRGMIHTGLDAGELPARMSSPPERG
jgi:predicted Rossmann-fold nucleotide-binding protein